MIIFPAIDIKGGKCVRLLKGDFNKITQYKKSPIDQANEFSNLGFKNIHLIDLDGALAEKPINENIIKEISRTCKIKIQIGGGIRSNEQIKKLLDFGVDKIILGTAAVNNIEFLKKACDEFSDKIALSIDVRKGYIALSGWKKQTNILASDFIKKIEKINISRIIYTDIDKDGTKSGPNIKETVSLSNLTKIPFVISGGVSSINDVISIKKNEYQNIEGIIIGKAIYDGNIDIKKLSKII
ncbi:MAG: 1-(5-phosphoribosyl)-5-[(5-phosphoribosylamino)methylideneamino]imidazole-4-carboxamide isomerase [Candidatus Pelagibacterales bacterium]|nr:MAG: 1-(5-phosphoribosyl)-5-[(5-phosphoribosylamino)methylideneamino]imidazole-4-carboxamide isomerase [Pelagibacterales bacterium]